MSFTATYHLWADSADEASAVARDLCVEQTVEFPIDLISRRDILENIVAKVEGLCPIEEGCFEATLVFSDNIAGDDFIQFLNALLGNSGLKPNIRLVDFSLSTLLRQTVKGPRFGITGIRRQLGVDKRPLLATALKPMGLSSEELAGLAYQYAKGGIDIVKDDHGLADQPFSRFEDRVLRCADSVSEANARFSRRCLYAPNITGPMDLILERAQFAKNAGATGALIAPGLVGFDAMRALSADDEIALPILCHPAFMGPIALSSRNGISHAALFGSLCRTSGADVSIFPSFGGRFSFSKDECREITTRLRHDADGFQAAFPAPAGGMTLGRVGELISFYGNDTVLLIGGDLHRGGDSLVEACKAFLRRVEDDASF
jgi:ribulose-bisphosphate carboxylase large chain